MKKVVSFVCLLLVGSVGFCQSVVETENFILKIDKIVSTESPNIIPWVKVKDGSWSKAKPIFQIKDKTSELQAKGWIANTDENLLLKIVVTDDVHFNRQEEADLYKGDAIQIGIDPQGQGAGNMPKETSGMVGNDDAGLGFGIGKNGPQGFAWFLESNWVSIPLNKGIYKISRSESKKTTTYDLTIPWTMLNTKPGAFPSMGIAIQINDSDPNSKDQKRISWGDGAGGNSTPGLFQKLLFSNPLKPFWFGYRLNQEVWQSGDTVEMCFSVASSKALKVEASCGGKTVSLSEQGNSKLIINRYSVKLLAKSGKLPSQLLGGLYVDKQRVDYQEINILVPKLIIDDFFSRIDSLIAVPTNPLLFIRHLNSVKSLVMIEWAKTNLYQNDQRAVKETFQFINNINEGLKGDAGKWESYLKNERSLTMAFISKRDGTLQYYSLDLPKSWNIENEYPLFLELHGSGNQNPIATLSSQLSPSATSLDLHGYTSTKSFTQQQGVGYHVAPFGRGNTRYKDIGEIDVMEAYQDADKVFKIDNNRKYLYGFSMGGGGTWSIGLRTPDMWAAIGVFAGGMWNEKSTVNIAKNASYLPVFLWCGEKDDLFASFLQMQKALEQDGVKPEVRTTKGLGHNYPDSIQAVGLNWMMKFTRKRPNQFSFVADKDEHLGVWGITMTREESVSGLPSFNCTIEGQKLTINSKGTSGLKINLGTTGLNMPGKVSVIWNEQIVYEGYQKEITVGNQLISDWD